MWVKAKGKFLVFRVPQFQGQGYEQGTGQSGFSLFMASGLIGGLDASLSHLFLPHTSMPTPIFSGEAGKGRQQLTKKNETLDNSDPSP